MTEDCKCGEHCKCGDKYHSHEEHGEKGCCDMPEKFLQIADKAWKKLLIEKIKENIEKEHGEHMTKLAEILTKANGDKWKHKIEAKMCGEEYKNSLKEFFESKK